MNLTCLGLTLVGLVHRSPLLTIPVSHSQISYSASKWKIERTLGHGIFGWTSSRLLISQSHFKNILGSAISVNGLVYSQKTYDGESLNVTDGDLVIEDCQFLKCNGAVYLTNANMNVGRCLFRGNKAKAGAAIMATNCGNVYLDDCIFTSNTADEIGGAVYLSEIVKSGMMNCKFAENECKGDASALNVVKCSAILLTACNFRENRAAGNGTVYCHASNLVMSDSIFVGNEASYVTSVVASDSLVNISTVTFGDKKTMSVFFLGDSSGVINTSRFAGVVDDEVGGTAHVDILMCTGKAEIQEVEERPNSAEKLMNAKSAPVSPEEPPNDVKAESVERNDANAGTEEKQDDKEQKDTKDEVVKDNKDDGKADSDEKKGSEEQKDTTDETTDEKVESDEKKDTKGEENRDPIEKQAVDNNNDNSIANPRNVDSKVNSDEKKDEDKQENAKDETSADDKEDARVNSEDRKETDDKTDSQEKKDNGEQKDTTDEIVKDNKDEGKIDSDEKKGSEEQKDTTDETTDEDKDVESDEKKDANDDENRDPVEEQAVDNNNANPQNAGNEYPDKDRKPDTEKEEDKAEDILNEEAEEEGKGSKNKQEADDIEIEQEPVKPTKPATPPIQDQSSTDTPATTGNTLFFVVCGIGFIILIAGFKTFCSKGGSPLTKQAEDNSLLVDQNFDIGIDDSPFHFDGVPDDDL